MKESIGQQSHSAVGSGLKMNECIFCEEEVEDDEDSNNLRTID
jgi:hypothetical protein